MKFIYFGFSELKKWLYGDKSLIMHGNIHYQALIEIKL